MVSEAFAETTDRVALGPLVRTPDPALDWTSCTSGELWRNDNGTFFFASRVTIVLIIRDLMSCTRRANDACQTYGTSSWFWSSSAYR
ncbi:BZ3500_MvSof-1268-A1-R1_Chr1-1g00845 [Microbotryum saponariae]|uniref:BZ3500_MvSof-1268-A1-R1_Chr1-1g00845 protein n=1 Tax=Microbotryum saponariae TaxID=289078 RepID=A0A2X0KJ58_9BASI|nr:BZ3500_MvSof-1268-A1-R1_Chr1-1g00845 [Microbotryum saponariae]SCZ92767.1 BZ3501_MvSof-1269-A2-R1_Chr1-1g00442 [Microbotryum saponariae]